MQFDVRTASPLIMSLLLTVLGGCDDSKTLSLSLSLLAGPLGGAGYADGSGADARFNYPAGVVHDGYGNLYVVDAFNHVVRKIDIATGEVTTFAGKMGEPGSADGPGNAARFKNPRGIISDGGGNLYLADTDNHTIRKVTIDSRTVSTIAGKAGAPPGSDDGTGDVARFDFPIGMALDGKGNLFVAENNNHTIRQVVLGSGLVKTIAGVPGQAGYRDRPDGTGLPALFNRPYGMACDGLGNVFVADSLNKRIRQVGADSGVVTTLAGSGLLAWADSPGDGTGTDARFDHPQGLIGDGDGNLLVAEASRIRKVVLQSRVVTTLAGSFEFGSSDGTGANARFGQLRGMALDAAGDLYITDQDNNTVRKMDLASGATATLAGSAAPPGSADGTGSAARFDSPSGVASDGQGNLFLTDYFNNTIRQVVLATGVVTTLAGSASEGGSQDGTGADARFDAPTAVVSDGMGNLFMADLGNNTIRQMVIATGAVTTLAGKAGEPPGSVDGTGDAARFKYPEGVALDSEGNLYIADGGNHEIRKLSVSTREVTTVAGAPVSIPSGGGKDGIGRDARFNFPYAVAYDGRGNLFILDDQTIRKMILARGEVITVAGKAGEKGRVDGLGKDARFSIPYGIASDGKGHLYIADTNNHVIRKMDTGSGRVTTFAGTPEIARIRPGPLPAELAFPSAVAVIPSGLAVIDGNSLLTIE